MKVFTTAREMRLWKKELREMREAKIKKKLKPGDRACFYAEWSCGRAKTSFHRAAIPKGMTYEQAMDRYPPMKEKCGPFSSQEKAEADWVRAIEGVTNEEA